MVCWHEVRYDQQVQDMQAADFLCDDTTLQQASAYVARLAFPVDSRVSPSEKLGLAECLAEPDNRKASRAASATQVHHRPPRTAVGSCRRRRACALLCPGSDD